MPAEIFIFGASGHAKVVLDCIEQSGRERVAFLVDDAEALHGTVLFGYRVVGGRAWLEAAAAGGEGQVPPRSCVVAIGANPARRAVAAWLGSKGFDFVAAVHPRATLGRGSLVGAGTAMMAGAVLNSDSRVAAHCIINTSASVDHDCDLGEFVHIGPGARICGGVSIGSGTLIGAGAVVIPGIRIGAQAVVGAGAVVVRDIPDGARLAGVPARLINHA